MRFPADHEYWRTSASNEGKIQGKKTVNKCRVISSRQFSNELTWWTTLPLTTEINAISIKRSLNFMSFLFILPVLAAPTTWEIFL